MNPIESEIEVALFQIIAYSSHAFNLYYEAISFSRLAQIDEAMSCLQQANEAINQAHVYNKELLELERNHEIKYSILMIHAQNQLMNAINWQHLAKLEQISKKG